MSLNRAIDFCIPRSEVFQIGTNNCWISQFFTWKLTLPTFLHLVWRLFPCHKICSFWSFCIHNAYFNDQQHILQDQNDDLHSDLFANNNNNDNANEYKWVERRQFDLYTATRIELRIGIWNKLAKIIMYLHLLQQIHIHVAVDFFFVWI